MKELQVQQIIELCDQMIARYKAKMEAKPYDVLCPVCEKFKVDFIYCDNCFNITNGFISTGCIYMKTFPITRHDFPWRLLYWNEVSKYLHSLRSETIDLDVLRDKCNEIDNQLL